MKRLLYKNLLDWKQSGNRKPLLLQGARQVGKTWLIKQFGKTEYSDFVYVNLEENSDLKSIFKKNLNPELLIENLGYYFGRKINGNDTLIFFDEIQEIPEAITSLKYFYEQAPQYHIIAAGSLLGVTIGSGHSFPVGKVRFMTLYPLSFNEFLLATGNTILAELLDEKPSGPLQEGIHNKLTELLKQYLFLGGMPEVISDFIKNRDIEKARQIQIELLESVKRDFSKHTDKRQAIKTLEVWNSIPYQLARESKKFKYNDVRKKARASYYEQTIEWLKGAGLIYKITNISTGKLPLSGYANPSKFKIYLMDHGLLGAMLDISPDIIISPDKFFKEYYGAFIENYVASELIISGITNLFYWSSNGMAEVDFVFQNNDKIIPLEVKSGTNRNLKSLRSFEQKNSPEIIVRTSPRNFEHRDNFYNIPLYWISKIKNLV